MFYKPTGIFCEANNHLAVKYSGKKKEGALLRHPLLSSPKRSKFEPDSPQRHPSDS